MPGWGKEEILPKVAVESGRFLLDLLNSDGHTLADTNGSIYVCFGHTWYLWG